MARLLLRLRDGFVCVVADLYFGALHASGENILAKGKEGLWRFQLMTTIYGLATCR